MTLIEKIAVLKKEKKLPTGWTVKIAESFKVTPQYVSDISRGVYVNVKIAAAIVELAEANQRLEADVNTRLNNLILS